jgi:hypothetical protein
MRFLAILAVLAAPAPAQEPSSPTGTADVTFAFTVEQGWSMTAESDRELFTTTERELTQGINPSIRLDPNQPNPPTTVRNRNVPAREGPANPSTFRRTRGDPLKIEGSVTLQAEGKATFTFQKIEYWDSSQRWSIEVESQKIKTLELGGTSRWKGTRQEWTARLDELEKAFIDKYLKTVTPQRPEDLKAQIGLVPAAQEPGRRLYVTQCLEEQLAVLLLARLDGAIITRSLWPAECAKYPPKSIQVTRSLIDRLMAQCAGELAPPKVKASRSRSVQNAAWDSPIAALPVFAWPDGVAWAAEQTKPFEESRRRLADLATQSGLNGGIDLITWSNTVQRELRGLQQPAGLAVPAKPASIQDALLEPRLLALGKGVYDCKEDLDLKEGKVTADELEASGLMKEIEVAFFVSGPNRWHASKIRYESWYHGKVKRQ